MPGIDQVVRAVGRCERSVQYAVSVLEQLGCIRRLAQGRDWLSRAERLELWRRGSRARAYRAIWAMTPPMPIVDNHPAAYTRNPGTCTLPTRVLRTSSSYVPTELNSSFCSSSFDSNSNLSNQTCAQPAMHSQEQPKEEAAPPPRQPKKARRAWDDDLVAFAVDLQRALPGQLAGERPSRLAGTLTRFHRAHWTAVDLASEVAELYRRRGYKLPFRRPRRPYAWLAAVLRDIDPHDNPAVWRDAYRAHLEMRRRAPDCPHGLAGGDLDRPGGTGPECALCRP